MHILGAEEQNMQKMIPWRCPAVSVVLIAAAIRDQTLQ